MDAIWAILIVIIAGCFGGLINPLISGSGLVFLPHKDKESNAYDMGLLNKVLVGGIAAFVLWGLYGPFSSLSLGTDKMSIALTIRDVAGSILTGLGGGRLLTIEIDKQNLQVSRNQLVDKIVEVSRNQLVD